MALISKEFRKSVKTVAHVRSVDCRKNDPGSRPHSWYSSKLTGEELESAKREATAATVWQPKNEPK